MKSSSFSKRRFFSVLLVLCLFAATFLVGCGDSADTGDAEGGGTTTGGIQQLTFGTMNQGGGYMLMGTAIAKIMNDNLSDRINVTPVPDPIGSQANIDTVVSRERELGLATSNVVKDNQAASKDFQTWFSAHYGVVWTVATEDSGIRTFADLVGKRVAIGAPSSNDEMMSINYWFPAHGIDIADVDTQLLKLSEAQELMKDGHLDAFILTVSPNNATMAELAASREIRFFPMDKAALESVVAEHSDVLIKTVEEGGTPGMLMETPTIEVPALAHVVVISPDLDEQLVYDMTKAVFENLDDIYAVSKEFEVVTLEGALMGLEDVHPGAMRYFEEMNVSQ